MLAESMSCEPHYNHQKSARDSAPAPAPVLSPALVPAIIPAVGQAPEPVTMTVE